MPKEISTFIVDSFTDQAFKGNPAGVCLLEQPLSDWEMQSIATELNLSETAFLSQEQDHWNIRYFSPKMEIPLCGHATLASAQVLVEKYAPETIDFITGHGLKLKVKPEAESLVMEFPRYRTCDAEIPAGMLQALGIDKAINSVFNEETRILMIEIESTKKLKELAPDFNALLQTHDSLHGVLITTKGTEEYDFHSRYFWPWSGSNEDPVTGATHTFMAPYWGERLMKNKMKSFQASARTGFMDLELLDDQLLIKGMAVMVLEGFFKI
ncbi:MAG: PhzF family phenazine biosynthesis protein [Cytophagales bacterium]|nr:PhzF family phenazine biosynthesis protein [Cytophagales bacterium]